MLWTIAVILLVAWLTVSPLANTLGFVPLPPPPEKLSTDLTSLNYESDRLAIVIEMVFAGDGSLQSSDLYGATVRNRAKLAYNSVASWLEGNGPLPQGIGPVSGLDVGDRVRVKLVHTDVERGFIDFVVTEAPS